jgi:hypothetical protein
MAYFLANLASKVGGPQIDSHTQIRKFFPIVDLSQMWQYADLQFADHIFLRFADLQLRTQLFIADLKLSQIRKYHIVLPKNICLTSSHSNLRITFGFWDSFADMAFRSLKYTYVGKSNIGVKPVWISIQNTVFFLKNLRICDLRTGIPKKIADLRFAD